MSSSNRRERCLYRANWTTGTVRQYDNRVHEGAADGMGHYPSVQDVSGS